MRYHLRIQLRPDHPKSHEDALWKLVRSMRADEVMFFAPHVEAYSPGMGTLEDCERLARRLKPAFRRLRAAGVTPSINIFWTVSFSNFPALPRDQRATFPQFRWAVGVDGRTSAVVACPQDSAWRAHAQEVYRSFARLKPARLWIDDDFRSTLKADLHSPCFCDVCLDAMAQRTGQQRSRRELVKAILADPPNPIRNAWLKFQGEMMRGVAAGLAEAVHEVSPGTQMGIMFGAVEFLFADGRRWDEFLPALGEPRPIARPPAGPYLEGSPVQFADGFNATRMAQAVLPAERVTLAPEIENFPNTQFDKSARAMRLQMELCQLLGINEITISIYPHEDRFDLRYEKVWERTLAAVKPRIQAIADLGIAREQLRGIGLAWHQDVCRFSRVSPDVGKPVFVYRQRPWDTALPLLGFATCYGHDREVTAMSAELPEAYSDDEIRQIFSRGVLLDARAADSMLRRGLGDLVGVEARIDDARAAIETLDDPLFATYAGEAMMVRANGIPWQFKLRPEARVISKLRGYRGEETGHGAFVFENSLGGRVTVLPFDSQADGFLLGITSNAITSPTFLCFARQAQMVRVLDWLGRRPVPLFVPDAPNVIPLLVEQPGRLIVAVANLCSDPIERLAIRLAPPGFRVRRVRSLNASGAWQKCAAKVTRSADGAIHLRTGLDVDHFDVAILELSGD